MKFPWWWGYFLELHITSNITNFSGRRGSFMVCALAFGSVSLVSSPGWGHGIVFLGKTLVFTLSASLHLGV